MSRLEDLQTMSGRIKDMRVLLKEKLKEAGSTLSWEHITDQIGMFCYTGLTQNQVGMLVNEYVCVCVRYVLSMYALLCVVGTFI